jgi:hypothetical protein
VEPVVQRCAGIDIGKANLKATVRVQGGPGRKTRREVRTFDTTTPALLRLRDWLVDEQVTLAGTVMGQRSQRSGPFQLSAAGEAPTLSESAEDRGGVPQRRSVTRRVRQSVAAGALRCVENTARQVRSGCANLISEAPPTIRHYTAKGVSVRVVK